MGFPLFEVLINDNNDDRSLNVFTACKKIVNAIATLLLVIRDA